MFIFLLSPWSRCIPIRFMPVGYQQSLRAFSCRYLYSTNGKHNYCCTTSLYTVDPVYTLVQIPAELSRPSKPLQKGDSWGNAFVGSLYFPAENFNVMSMIMFVASILQPQNSDSSTLLHTSIESELLLTCLQPSNLGITCLENESHLQANTTTQDCMGDETAEGFLSNFRC